MSVDLELDLGAKIELAFGKAADKIAERLAPHKPINNVAVGALQYVSGSGEQFIDLGSPAVGRVWEITSITVYSADAYTTLANVHAALYFGDTMVPSLTSLRVPALNIPSFTAIGDECLYCESIANVVVGVSGTASGQVAASVTYKDWPEAVLFARNGMTMK